MTKLSALPTETTITLSDFLVKVKAAGAGDTIVTLQNVLTQLYASGVWWQELGRTTLGSSGNTISVTGLTAKTYLQIIVKALATGGTITTGIRFNNDTAANYGIRQSANGATDATVVSQTSALISESTGAYNSFSISTVLNITAQEKIGTSVVVETGTAGAANIGNKAEVMLKWANTAAQITRVDVINTGGGSFNTGSEVIVLGHN